MMIELHDLRWLTATVREIYACQTSQDFFRIAGTALDAKFGLLASACEEVGAQGSLYIPHRLRLSVAPPRDWFAFFHDNPFSPLVGRDSQLPLLHMSHDVPRSRWHRTDHYNGIARPMGWNDQLMIVAQNRGTLVAVGMYRDALFSSHERELALLLQPHLVAGWRRVSGQTQTDPLLEPLSIELGPDLRPFGLSFAQRTTLADFFPSWAAASRLPMAIESWVRESRARLQETPAGRPLHALRVQGRSGELFARCFPSADQLRTTLRLVVLPHKPPRSIPELSKRQAEVLRWLAEGKRDAEIAQILDIATATVSKHVEHLLAKFHARSRTELAVRSHVAF